MNSELQTFFLRWEHETKGTLSLLYQHSFARGEPIQKELDFSWRKHIWRCFPLGALTNQADRIEIKQLVTARVIKDHGHQVADLRATTFRKRKSP
jgi:hypothetical protein